MTKSFLSSYVHDVCASFINKKNNGRKFLTMKDLQSHYYFLTLTQYDQNVIVLNLSSYDLREQNIQTFYKSLYEERDHAR